MGGSYAAYKHLNATKINNPVFNTIAKLVAASPGACWDYFPASSYAPEISEAQLIFLHKTTPAAATTAVQNAINISKA